MELTAAIEGLNALRREATVRVTTDSPYVRDGITKWLPQWKRRGWKTAEKKPVKNEYRWRAHHTAAQRHSGTWHWVRGHDGHPENERADALARAAIAHQRRR